jgi:uncharacterized protein YndB with AHSA1/START domain
MAEDNGSTSSVVIERTLDAPIDLIWRMWTEPDLFSAWYGPEGATTTVATMEVRVGGTRLVRMSVTSPQGSMDMWFTGVYREVVENKRLVYTESMSDERGTILSPSEIGMPAGHPTTTEVVVELSDLGARTRMTLTHVGIAAASPGALGWTMALDKLAAQARRAAGTHS